MWVQRNSEGKITGAFMNRQEGYAEEYLEDNDPELIAYLNPPPPRGPIIRDRLAAIDAQSVPLLRAVVSGTTLDSDLATLAALQTEYVALTAELAALQT